MTKICSKCGFEGAVDQFVTKGRWCKKCKSKIDKDYREINKHKISTNRAKTYIKNRESNIARVSKWQRENKIHRAKYHRNRRSADPLYKLQTNLRTRLNSAIKRQCKSGSAIQDLGCSIKELKLYLEVQFQPGMTWDNHGEWHIDHIQPLCKFDLTNREELLIVCHYTNLQPLWASDNISKGGR